MTRQQALDYCHRYDGEYPKDNLAAILEYLSMSEEEFNEIVDLHRNDEIWVKEPGQNEQSWSLRYPLPIE